MQHITNLEKRVENLSPESICSLMEFNQNDISFGMDSPARTMLNKKLVKKFETFEIDEIELLIVESGE